MPPAPVWRGAWQLSSTLPPQQGLHCLAGPSTAGWEVGRARQGVGQARAPPHLLPCPSLKGPPLLLTKARAGLGWGCCSPSPWAPVSFLPGPPGPQFPSPLTAPLPLGDHSPKGQSTFQKLLHVNATAQLEHPEYSGPLLPASALVPRPSALDRKVTPLQKELQGALKGLLGSADRGRFTVPMQYGWVLGEAPLCPAY